MARSTWMLLTTTGWQAHHWGVLMRILVRLEYSRTALLYRKYRSLSGRNSWFDCRVKWNQSAQPHQPHRNSLNSITFWSPCVPWPTPEDTDSLSVIIIKHWRSLPIHVQASLIDQLSKVTVPGFPDSMTVPKTPTICSIPTSLLYYFQMIY